MIKPKVKIEKKVSPQKQQMQKTFYGLDLSLIKSLKMEEMLTEEEVKEQEYIEEKDFEQIRRENMIDDKGKHAIRLRSACL